MKNTVVSKITKLITTTILLRILYENLILRTTRYTIKSKKLPQAFNGFKIAHLSDIHNTMYRMANSQMVHILNKQKPDVIVITGDLINGREPRFDCVVELCEKLVNIAPCYYVIGNHEVRIQEDFYLLEKELQDTGVHILRNEEAIIHRNKEWIQMIGIDDPLFGCVDHRFVDSYDVSKQRLESISQQDGFKIILCHRPELFDLYHEKHIDLALTGHAHGGQVHIPFIGGVLAPSQGFFPEFDHGLYQKDDTTMILSSGIGNGIIPLRINNQPEVVIVTLKVEK